MPKKPLVLDLDNLDDRKARLTIHSSSLGDALVSKDGETLYYLARFEKGMNLWSTNLRTKETKMLTPLDANGASMQWSKDKKTIFLLADGSISKIDPSNGKKEAIKLGGEEALDVAAERAAEFDHVWRRTRDTFYSHGYHGIDWVGLRPVYAKYLPYIADNWDFSEMLAEMLGELNISHSEATYNPSNPTADATASLGVFLDQTYTGPGVKVDEVIEEGPLDRVGVNVKPGTIIQAVDGVAIAPAMDIAELLNRKAGKNVLLTVADGASSRDVVVKPVTLADENRLLYTRWVRRNEREVDSVSHGELG
jgi:C-terminal processing protease CtpA/Prc